MLQQAVHNSQIEWVGENHRDGVIQKMVLSTMNGITQKEGSDNKKSETFNTMSFTILQFYNFTILQFYNLYVHLKKYCYADEDKENWRVGMQHAWER